MFERVRALVSPRRGTSEFLTHTKVAKESADMSFGGRQWLLGITQRGYTTQSKKFITDIYSEKLLTPHAEMTECRRITLTNPRADSAKDTLADIILGDRITVSSEDEKTVEFFDQWMDETKFRPALKLAVRNYIAVGPGYIEMNRFISGPRRGEVGEFSEVEYPELIYKEMNPEQNKIIRYIKEVERGVEPPAGARDFTFKYTPTGEMKTIFGVEIPPEKLLHIAYGGGPYGRSPFASAINDEKVVREQKRAAAVMARFKAVPKKFVSLLNSDGTSISSIERDETLRSISNLEDFENPIVNKKVEAVDMSYGGREINMVPMMEKLEKNVTNPAIPSFYSDADATNYAVSGDQKEILFLRVGDRREEIGDVINPLLRQIAEAHGLDKNVKLKCGKVSLGTESNERKEIVEVYNAGIITLNEARQQLGLEEIPDGDEVKPQGGFGGMGIPEE